MCLIQLTSHDVFHAENTALNHWVVLKKSCLIVMIKNSVFIFFHAHAYCCVSFVLKKKTKKLWLHLPPTDF